MTIGDDALHVCAVVLSDGVLFAAGQFWDTAGKTRSEHMSSEMLLIADVGRKPRQPMLLRSAFRVESIG